VATASGRHYDTTAVASTGSSATPRCNDCEIVHSRPGWYLLGFARCVQDCSCIASARALQCIVRVIVQDVTPRSAIPPDAPLGWWLDPVMQAFATLPRLTQLRLFRASDFGSTNVTTNGMPWEGSSLSGNTRRQLCAFSRLQSLCLIHCNLSYNVTFLPHQLDSNETMKELDQNSSLSIGGAQVLASRDQTQRGLEFVRPQRG
jgi:hypothetical protein